MIWPFNLMTKIYTHLYMLFVLCKFFFKIFRRKFFSGVKRQKICLDWGVFAAGNTQGLTLRGFNTKAQSVECTGFSPSTLCAFVFYPPLYVTC